MEVLLFVLVDASVVAAAVLSDDGGEVAVGDLLLLLMVPRVFPHAVLATAKRAQTQKPADRGATEADILEDHVAEVHETMVVVRVSELALVEAVVLRAVMLAVLAPEVLAVPVGVLREGGQVDGGGGLALLVADRRIPLAERLRVGQIGALVERGHFEGALVEGAAAAAVLQRLHHALRQLVLAVGQLRVLPFVLALVREQLSGTVQHVVALRSDAVDVVADLREATVLVWTRLVLHELFEAVPRQLLVLYVVRLVLL